MVSTFSIDQPLLWAVHIVVEPDADENIAVWRVDWKLVGRVCSSDEWGDFEIGQPTES